jgi:hypothetical protein
MKYNQIKPLLFEFLALIILIVAIPFFISVDINILKNELSEISFTEFIHELFILISAIMFYKVSIKNINSKGFFILLSALFIMMFIREMDYFLDFIFHGFWKIPVGIILLITLYSVYKNKNTIIEPLVKYGQTKWFTYIFIGLLVIFIFSRVFGTGSLWRDIMGDDYNHIYKTVIQEGIELFGYGLVFLGSLFFYFKKDKLTL